MTTPGGIRIRAAGAADAARIRRTIRSAGLDPTGLDWRRFKLAVTGSDELVGMCQVRRYWGTKELGSLWVADGYRQQGLGAMLIRACLADQTPPVHLECVQARQPYYEKFGFRKIPVLRAPRGLRLKSGIGGVLARVFAGERIIVMQWDGEARSPAKLADQGDEGNG